MTSITFCLRFTAFRLIWNVYVIMIVILATILTAQLTSELSEHDLLSAMYSSHVNSGAWGRAKYSYSCRTRLTSLLFPRLETTRTHTHSHTTYTHMHVYAHG